ncbi:MAG: TlpA family protein disulfide reductase [Acidobacteriaceae bacterium]|nr:TlpA family protein disulfide reductase [Acidobacteriaceae bacterium]
MANRTVVTLLAASVAALFVSCSTSSSAHSARKEEPVHTDRKPAPDFSLRDANGASVKLSDYKGKVVLLNFWATWCGPCALEIPWFEEFEQQFKSRGFEVLGVSMDEDGWKAVKPYLVEHRVNYRVVLGNDSVTQLYGGVDSLPTSFLIDRDGKVAYVHVGLAGKNEYQDEIQNLLGAAQTNQTTAALSFVPAALVSGTAK